MTEVELFTTEEAARLLGRSPQTLANWRVQGNGPPFVRIGPRNVFYRSDDLQAYMEHRHRSTSEYARAA